MKRTGPIIALALVVAAVYYAQSSRGGSDVDTTLFDGSYTLDTIASAARVERDVAARPLDDTTKTRMLALAREAERRMRARYDNFTIKRGVVRSGTILVQEIRFLDGITSGDSLRGHAQWHEDIHDPGDYSEEIVTLRLRGDTLELVMHDETGKALDPIRLIRK